MSKRCNMQFPHFGAEYPDACCINGYLWDLDSSDENGCLTIGGDDPCPFCNTDEWVADMMDKGYTKESLLKWKKRMEEKYTFRKTED